MNRIITALLTIMGVIALSFISTAPANAGTDEVTYCKAIPGDYEQKTEKMRDVFKAHAKKAEGAWEDSSDVIPAFEFTDEEKTRQYFDGQNLEHAFLLENDCKAPTIPHNVVESVESAEPVKSVEAVPPVFAPATCLNITGTVTKSEQPEGVELVVGPKLNSNAPPGAAFTGSWVTVYEALDGYEFKDGTKMATFINPVIAAGPGDPDWVTDSKTGKGQCELPETGAGIYGTELVLAGGLIGLGMVFLGTVSLLNRRRA